MKPDIQTISVIQEEKQHDVNAAQLPPIDSEIRELAEGKRFTFDVINTPVDPLR